MNPALANPRRSRSAGGRGRAAAGFTILEVMVAASVLVLGISSALLALQYGLRAIDTARNTTLAAQVIQSQMEVLRLQNWSQLEALQHPTGTLTNPFVAQGGVTISEGNTSTPTPLDTMLTGIANRFTFTRTISDVTTSSGAVRPDIKQIVMQVTWNGMDGRPHALSYQLRYAKNGLNDYFYVAH